MSREKKLFRLAKEIEDRVRSNLDDQHSPMDAVELAKETHSIGSQETPFPNSLDVAGEDIGSVKELDSIDEIDANIDNDERELSLEDGEELQKAAEAIEFLADIRNAMSDTSVGSPLFDVTASSLVDSASTSIADLGSEEKPAGKTANADSSLPAKLGRFEILSQLGQGGFGKVLLARDPELSRLVALKVPNPAALISEEATRRFELEAKATSILTHPVIVPVFESSSHGPFKFLVSAYCPGPTLYEWFESKHSNVGIRTAAKLIANLAAGVHHAHQRGVIHRDLKPSNVLIECATNELDSKQDFLVDESAVPDQARITDFGLARLAENADTSLTKIGAVVGTPSYMSPEQADGKQEITSACDTFSLGAMLYELLTGTPPFQRDGVIKTLQAVANDEPIRPRKLRKEIDRDLESICLKCLNKKPSERYESAHALSNDLLHWLEGRPVIARQATGIERLRKWGARNPALAAVCAALLITMFALAGGLIVAVQQWQLANQQSKRAERHLATTQTTINELSGDVARDPSLPTDLRLKIAKRASEMQDRLLQDEPSSEKVKMETAHTYANLGQVLIDAREYENAQSALEVAEDILTSLPEGPKKTKILDSVQQGLARALRGLGKPKEALAYSKNILDNQDEQTVSDYRRAKALENVGVAHMNSGDYVEAKSAFNQALEIYEKVETPNIFAAHTHASLVRLLAQTAIAESDFEEADILFELALELRASIGPLESYHDFDSQEELRILSGLLNANFSLSNFGTARKYLGKVKDFCREWKELNPSRLRTINEYYSDTYAIGVQLFLNQELWLDADAELKSFQGQFDENANGDENGALNTGYMLSQCYLLAAETMWEEEQFKLGDKQLEAADRLVDRLLKSFPNDDEITSLRSRIDELSKNLERH